MELKQQLELMKMCGRVNSNPSLAQNENFRLLVSKCTGVTPVKLDNRPADGKSKWDKLKDNYKKENPGSKLKTAVTGDVKPGSKAAKRRKSFCARSKGWTGERGKAARKRWKC